MAGFSVVGIGSSAGGLDALQKLFRVMPPDSGLAFVVAAHLDPTQESHLTGLLGRCTDMPVEEVKAPVTVRPSHAYVIAPDQHLTIKDGVLHPSKPKEPRGQRRPVDGFLRSLAEDQGERAIGIILSGTGTNGSQGLRFVKSEGGITIAQDPGTAEFDGMPRNAIATGLVDLVLAPEKMAEVLLKIGRHSYVREPAKVGERAEVNGELNTLLALVRLRTREDFGCYRRRTLLRRIHRRMGLRQIEGLASYIEQLRNDAAEIEALSRDLTINVSGFFRDPEAWRALEREVIEPLVAERSSTPGIRIWVPGCATGEEAYSLAMMVIEHAERANKPLDLKIFATDVADTVLSAAREGLYPGSITGEVSAERLERFFDREDDSFRVRRTLRERVTFAPQNLLQDPPFSRVDLISCRNLLIYLEPEVQKKLLALFHFALREGGSLFLGSSETVSSQEDLFHPISKRWRIYRRLGPTRHDVVDFPLVRGSEVGTDADVPPHTPPTEPRRYVTEGFRRALLDRFVPAAVLVDRHFRALAFQGPTGDYLQQPGGEPTSNLLALAREGLQVPLRQAVGRAIDAGQEIAVDGHVKRGGAYHLVRITATPLRGSGDEPMLMVNFFERPDVSEPSAPPGDDAERPTESELESELNATREDLRLTIEQMESSNEELQASYEEIRSINEELQASNEELETSKEELQSLNEELRTVNNQLEAKIQELEARTDDLNNLLNSTELATLFLDRNLRIRWFTPATKDLLELLPTDVGRPVAHFAQKFTGDDLIADAKDVLRTLVPASVEVAAEDGRWFIRTILPYRTDDNRIDGVVVTFTDFTAQKHAENEMRAAKEFAESIVDTVRDPLIVLTPELRVRLANDSFYRTFEVRREETEGCLIYELGNRQWDIPALRRLLEEVLPQDQQFNDFEVGHQFETIGYRTMLLNARRLDAAQLILLAIADVTERKQAEEERALLQTELGHRVKNLLQIVQSLAMQTMSDGESVERCREAFVGRLQALARAHTVLVDAQWRGADLRTIVEQALEAYRVDHPECIEVDGTPVGLTPKQSLGLSLVLHELGTNAAKYGALSRHDGQVRVFWDVETGKSHHLRLCWQERHGGEVAAPAQPGFGTRLIEQACRHELEGEMELDYGSGGLRFQVVFPLASG